MKQLQCEYLNARRVCGLNTLEAPTIGRLAGLDLSIRDTAEVTLGLPWTWTFYNLPNTVADVLIHHPQVEELNWLLSDSVSVSPDTARRLAREAPGWTVTLPESPAALIENSVTMRNCTRNYTSSVRAGAVFIVIVEDPTGRRFNASVVRKSGSNGRRYVVDQINSWANSGERPSWIAPALNRRLQQSALPLQLQRLHLQELFEPITTQLSADT